MLGQIIIGPNGEYIVFGNPPLVMECPNLHNHERHPKGNPASLPQSVQQSNAIMGVSSLPPLIV